MSATEDDVSSVRADAIRLSCRQVELVETVRASEAIGGGDEEDGGREEFRSP
jgi:hypothetical protein